MAMKENYPLDYPDPSAAKVWARVIKSFVLVAPPGLPLAGFFWNARLQCKTDHGDRGVQIDRDGWAKLRDLLVVLNEETKVMEMARKHTRHKHTREKVMEVICMTTAMCIANSPCGHLVYCQECFDYWTAQAMYFNSSCPMCRTSVVTTLHVFL